MVCASGVGSSPLTRGKRGERRKGQHVRGLIPAHAGKTPNPSWRKLPSWAHSRSRRENVSQPVHPCGDAGSSPLTRGKQNVRSEAHCPDGLIPAHAEKTELPRSAGSHHRAHPRSCRENAIEAQGDFAARDSSPLTRGKLGGAVLHGVPRGLIPAHAGKTDSLSADAALP